jgi:peptide-methionine (S)-S-oxide reductase
MNRTRNLILSIGLFLTAASVDALVNPGLALQEDPPAARTTIFAGGCFWCMEEAFEKVEGVSAVVSGYVGGTQENPTYEQVSSGRTGHYEAIEIQYDPATVGYDRLLEVFWHNIDPTDGAGQFCDKGPQYRAAIFYKDDEEKRLAEESKRSLEASKPFSEPIAAQILPASTFYAAEGYHQDYYKKNPIRYQYYKWGCGRAQRLEELWGPPEK